MGIIWSHERLAAGIWRAQPYAFAHVKLDGYGAIGFKQDDGRLLIFGRSVELTKQVEHLPWFDKMRRGLPPRSSICFEMVILNQHATTVSTALAERWTTLEAVVFAIPYWEGLNLQNSPLGPVAETTAGMGLEFAWYYPIPNDPALAYGASHWWYVMEQHNAGIRRLGHGHLIEGFMMKLGNYFGWNKLKKSRTVDVVVTRVAASTSFRLKGLAKSVDVAVYSTDGLLTEIGTVGGGFSDQDREELLGRGIIGRVMEVEFQNIASQGRMRSPRFLRWRDDKPAKQCLISQLEA